jgi:hypothetical protein
MVNAAASSTDRLVRHLTAGATGSTTDELAGWLASSPRFRAFADAHRDKIRKKLRGATDDASRLDVRAELQVAHRLLADRRISLAFEPGGSSRGGPDFAVTFRDHPAFNLEVTRPRRGPDAAAIRHVVLAKLRQLPAGAPNALLVVFGAGTVTAEEIVDAARELRSAADAGDPTVLARGRFGSPRDFYARFLRLGAVVTWVEDAPGGRRPAAWNNPSARIAVPGRALDACLAALGDA